MLAVTDVARAARFYERAFGWSRAVDEPVYVELAIPGGMRLGLYARRGFAANTGALPLEVPPGGLAPVELYLHTDDLDAVIARLVAEGARELSALAARPWGDEAAYLADLDGNVVVVARPGVVG